MATAALCSLALVACGDDAETDAAGGESGTWEPEQDISWIVPYSPGGGFDTYSRGIAEVMQNKLPDGVNIAVENIVPVQEGLTRLYTAESDGHTVGILPMPAAIAQQIQFPEVSAWETDQYTVLGQVDENAYVVYVAADSPYQSIEDLVAAQDLQTLTVERGSSSSLAALSTIEELGLDAELTYGAEGSQEVATAVLRGDADFFVYGTTDVIGFIESGDVRPLMFLGNEEQRPEEFEWLQDVPGAEEAGYPDLAGVVTELRIIVGPPDLPAPVAEYLRETLWDTMTDPEFIQWAEESDRPLVPRTADEAEQAMGVQIERMQELVPRLLESAGGL